MKKLSTSILLLGVFALSISFSYCNGKKSDAEIKTAIETALKADPVSAGTTVMFKNGVATISGECKDEACRNHCEELVKKIDGVKEVKNNCMVVKTEGKAPEQMPVSVTTVLDDATQQIVKDGLKDIKGVSVEFSGDKAILSGEVTKADRMKIMDMLASAKVKSNVDKLIDKK
jgi:osmotically-inducible protein OsmY